jgi:hypothetical protein
MFYLEGWWRDPHYLAERMVAALYPLAKTISDREQMPWHDSKELDDWIAIAVETVPKILATIHEEHLLGPTVAVEYGITVPLGGPERDAVHGRIDVLIETPETLTLLDAKAGGSIGKWVKADQLRLYACGVLADPKYARLPDRVGFWWLRHGKVVWKRLTRDTLLTFVGGVERTIAAVRAKSFEPTPGPKCLYCEFKDRCAAGQQYLWREKFTTTMASGDNAGRISL